MSRPWLRDAALVADLSLVVVDLGDPWPARSVGSLVPVRRALQAVGLAVERGDLLVGCADRSRYAGARSPACGSRWRPSAQELLKVIGMAALDLHVAALGGERAPGLLSHPQLTVVRERCHVFSPQRDAVEERRALRTSRPRQLR